MMSIKLVQFPRGKDIPNYSPFCLKLEAYFRFAGIPYENEFDFQIKKAPKQKMPYIKRNNELLGDSTLIIQKLVSENSQWDLDSHLTEEQKAISTLLQRTLEKHITTIVWHFRWATTEGWRDFRPIILGAAPKIIQTIVGGQMHKDAKKLSWRMDINRHTTEELLQMLDRDLKSISVLLGDKKFMFNDKISTIDCTLFGVLSQCVLTQQPQIVVPLFKKYKNIVDYVKNMKSMFDEKTVNVLKN